MVLSSKNTFKAYEKKYSEEEALEGKEKFKETELTACCFC